jgi:hypothetical protein
MRSFSVLSQTRTEDFGISQPARNDSYQSHDLLFPETDRRVSMHGIFRRLLDASTWSSGMNRWAQTFVISVAIGVVLSCSPVCSAAEQPSTSSHQLSKESPLIPPKTSPSQDARYLTDVAEADTHLSTYVQQRGTLALKAMLTDGTAFCAFLRRGGGIDDALLNVASGARSVESQTHLPSGVATFNAIEAVALIDLCPAEQNLVPASVRIKLRRLHAALSRSSS